MRLDPNGAQHWQAISSFGSLAVIDYSLEEQQHLRLLARWYSALRAGPTAEGAAETFKVVKQGRETVTLREFRPHCFFDLNCVQVSTFLFREVMLGSLAGVDRGPPGFSG